MYLIDKIIPNKFLKFALEFIISKFHYFLKKNPIDNVRN